MIGPVFLVVGIIIGVTGLLLHYHSERIGAIILIIGVIFIISAVPLEYHECHKPKTYEIVKISCYESYHEEQIVRVMVESPSYEGYYFYMYMTLNQFEKYKVKNERQLKITDKELETIPRTNNNLY